MNEQPNPQPSSFRTDFARRKTRRSSWNRSLLIVFLGIIIIVAAVNWQLAESPATVPPMTQTEPSNTESPVAALVSDTHSIALDLPRQENDSPDTTDDAELILSSTSESADATATFPTEDNNNWTKVVVQKGDNLSFIFKRLKLNQQDLMAILNDTANTKILTQLHPQQQLLFDIDNNQQVKKLMFSINPTDTLVIERSQSGYSSYHEYKQFEVQPRFTSGTIQDSLYTAAQTAGLPDKLIMELAYIFGWDIDFVLDIRSGDSFRVLYEENYLDGKPFGVGHILAAEFTTQSKRYQAIRYTNSAGNTDYYAPDGYSMRKAFLRTPVNFTRISSRFNLARKHPILHRIRAHRGVDYAAPRGTPVKASGDGKIVFIGRKGGYGKTIIIKHGQKYNTLYGHLNNFSRGMRNGRRVTQGQIIGYVGSTGLATGPHLHYEFLVNGVHRDPLKVALPKAHPVSTKDKPEFLAHTSALLQQINTHSQVELALKERAQ